jgi:DNA repair exonuclease SbcCD ATPase subunit
MDTPAAAPSAAPSSSPSSSPSTSSSPTSSGGQGGAPQKSAPLQGTTPKPAGAAPEPTPAQVATRFKRKEVLNGREVELEASEDELWASHRKARAADQRFEEAARLRKEAQTYQQQQAQMLADMKSNPRAVMKMLRENGIEDPMDFIANALQGELAEEERLQDPNVRARVQAEERLQALEQEREEYQQQQQQQQLDQRVNVELERIGSLFDAAVQELGGDLPSDDDTFAIMAELEMVNRRRGLEITPQQLARLTKERVIDRGVSTLMKHDNARLLALNPELTMKFRKALVEEYNAKQAAQQNPAARPPAPPPPARPADAPKLSDKEEHERLFGKRVLRTI